MVFLETLLTIATEKVGERLLTGIDATLNPQDVEIFLKQAIAAAKAAEPDLFYSFQEDGLQGYGPFLNRFFQGCALAELQKPLKENQGCPDADYLSAALWREAAGHAKLKALNKEKIPSWMRVFVETYFQATNRALQFQVIRADYCDQICRVFDDVKFAGIAVEGQDIERAERLADIFVMPDVQEDGRETQRAEIDDLPGSDDPQQRLLWEQQQKIIADRNRSGGRQFSAVELLTDGRTNRVVLLGAPGSGKSTLMNYFAMAGALSNAQGETPDDGKFQAALTRPLSNRLPIIIRIRDLARHPERSILEFVQEFAEKDLVVTRDLTGFFEYYLDSGSALVLLDGLDEVAEVAQRYNVVKKIEAFLGQFEHCPAIITSRPAGYKRDFFRTDEYPHYELQPFDNEKIDTFIEHWYDNRLELARERERRKASLRKALQEQPRIKQLARNPLLLTIIALIHRYQAKLPKERHKLYDKAVETLLTTWDSQREVSNHEILEYLELDDLRRLMERLAYWIHCQGGVGETEGGTLIDRDELIEQLTQYIREMKRVERHQAKAEAKRFLEQIVRDRAGLLSLQGQDRYGFVHKTFQEYLTAMEIRDRQEEGFDVVLQHITDYLHDPHWEEVLLLLISQQKRNNPVKVLKAILSHDTPYEPWLHRNLLFAGNVLGEDVLVADADLAHQILQRLMALEVRPSPLVTQDLRNRVLRIISNLYETAFESMALAQLERHQERLGRWRFLEYQGELAPEQVALTLVALLKDRNLSVCSSAAEALGSLGQGSPAVVEGLLELLKHRNSFVRSSAAAALVNLGQGSPAVVDALLELLKHSNLVVRSSAADTLGNLGQGSPAVVEDLLELLKHSNPLVRSRAAEALGKLGQRSPAVVEGLLELLKDSNLFVRSTATAALLVNLGQGSQAVVEGLLELLKNSDSDVCYHAAEALGNLGQGSQAVVEGLLELLKHSNSFVRSSAAAALGNLGQGSQAVVDSLLELLKHSNLVVRSSAADTLGNLGQGSPAVVDALLELLKHSNPHVRSRAADALGNLGQGSPAVVEGLLELLKHSNPLVRSRAAEALGNLGQGSPAVVDASLELLKDGEPFVCSSAAAALVKLGQKTNALEPALSSWIEQHQQQACVGRGVDALRQIVG